MPTPKKGEKKADFISRCIPFIINEDNEIDEVDQASGRCYGIWDSAHKNEAAAIMHSYASTQVDIPEDSPAAKEFRDLWIPDTQLHELGRESQPHITIKYGLTDPKALDKIRMIAGSIQPFNATFRGITTFEADEYDVLKVDVAAAELRYLNRKIGQLVENEDEHPFYRPHMTLAYMRKGKGKEWATDLFYRELFEGIVLKVSEIVYSDEYDNRTTIQLGSNTMAKEAKRLVLEAKISAPKPTDELTGMVWEVTIIGPKTPEHLVTINGEEFIRSENMRLYPVKMLEESVKDWDGVKVYDNHLTDEEFIAKQGMRSPKSEWLGTIVDPWWDAEGRNLKGSFKVVEEALGKKLKTALEQDVLNSVGLSIDTFTITTREVTYEGTSLPVVDGFETILSIDLVGEPAAGGSLDRLIASTQRNLRKKETTNMEKDEVVTLINATLDEKIEGLTSSIQSAVLEALAGNAENEDEAPEVEAEETEEEEAPEAEAETEDATEEVPDESEAMKEAKLARCELKLYRVLADAKLPKEMAETIQQSFEGRVFTDAELNKMVANMKKAQAALDPSGRVTESGASRRVQVGSNEYEKAEVDFLRLVAGNTLFKNLEGMEDKTVKERIPESYKAWMKGGRQNFNTRRISEWVYSLLQGDPLADNRAYEAVTTTGMSSIVKNTLNLMLAADYSVKEQWWDPIVTTEEVDTIDDATLVRVYGMNTLSIVEEGQPYTELGWSDEEETASFVKKGNYAGITLETLLKDKLNIVRSIPQRLSNSWYNTLSALVSGVFTVNTATGPVLADTGALFNATAIGTGGGHVNLLTTALGTTTAAYAAARLAMMKHTDQALGVGRRLMIQPKFLLVPVDLENQALILMNTREVPGAANNDINPYFQESQVIAVPDWTDTNNWALVADPARFPAIWLIFLTGQRVPQLFTSDQESAGAMFTNDTLRYKIRMLTYRYSSSYECAPVSDFRPLFKANCT